ncbi:hypothetical protein RSAG8_09316, partial [Rhizoctonia solani AG-8 WAC10335]
MLGSSTNELKNQEQEFLNRQRSINSLPPEVLSHIFVLCEYAGRPTLNIRNDPTRGHPNLICQTTLPAICWYWRGVALDTPALWSRVTLSASPPFRLSALYLSRSGTEAPLDIELKLTEKHWGYSGSLGLMDTGSPSSTFLHRCPRWHNLEVEELLDSNQRPTCASRYIELPPVI